MADDLDAPDPATGKTRLIVACEANQMQQARSLLTSRASPDAGTKDNQTPRECAFCSLSLARGARSK